jgi:hypothetical protein
MTSEQFVERIKLAVYDSTLSGVVQQLKKPGGRKPHASLLELSAWFNNLSAEDQAFVKRVIEEAAHSAVFGMLAVLDGVRSMHEADEPVGEFELRYNTDGHSDLISPPAGDFLHDLFNDIVMPS